MQEESKYRVGDIIFAKSGFDQILSKYKVIQVRHIPRNLIENFIEFKYEWDSANEIKKDPYEYHVEYDDDNIFMELEDIEIFRFQKLATSQIISN